MFPKTRFTLIILVFLLLNSIAHAQKTYCDPENRPDTCDNEDDRVCAYYTEDCILGLCGRRANNPCAACRQEGTIYYEPGACPNQIQVGRCAIINCDPEDAPFNPTCALKEENGQLISKTVYSTCEACDESSSFTHYHQGPCEKDKYTCVPGKKYCGKQPVCAYLQTDTDPVYTPVSNSAEACGDPDVDFYLKGRCGPFSQNRVHCLPNNRPEDCGSEDAPVCGFFTNEEGESEFQIMQNSCTACADPTVYSYTPGPCEFVCEPLNQLRLLVSCDPERVEPVCGTYIEDGQEVQRSVVNLCFACYETSQIPLKYIHGVCPGDEGIFDPDSTEEEL